MSEEFSTKTLIQLLGEHHFDVETLAGGVSCDTAKVLWRESGQIRGAVVKRALAQLRVPGLWQIGRAHV